MMSLFWASVAFTACSSDDDGGNGGKIGTNGSMAMLWPAYSAPFDRWGYINEDGEMVIAPQFKYASMFSSFGNGYLAAAQMEDGKICFIDTNGNIQNTSPFAAEDLEWIDIEKTYTITIIHTGEGDGLVNSNLEYILQPISGLRISSISEDGLIYCQKSGKYGCINMKGETVIGFNFDEIRSFHDGLAPACMNKKWGLIDNNGNYVVEAKYDGIAYITNNRYRFTNTTVYNAGTPVSYGTSTYGIIDGSGKEIAPAIYSDLVPSVSTNGWITARLKSKNLYGCIDTDGNTVLDFKFGAIGTFHDGIATASMNNKWGLIDYNGNYVVEAKYDGLDYITSNRYLVTVGSGYMPDGSFNPYYTTVYGIMDSTGKEIAPASYSYIVARANANGWFIARSKDNNLYGCLDSNGNIVLDFNYHQLTFDGDENIRATNEDGTSQIMDNAGNIVMTLEANEYCVAMDEDRDFFLYCTYDNNGRTYRYVKSGNTVYSWTE